MTDQTNIDKLFKPYEKGELNLSPESLEKMDQPIETFRNKGTPLISMLLISTAVMIAITIFFGFFYELGFKDAKISSKSELTKKGISESEAGVVIDDEKSVLKKKIKDKLETAFYVMGGLGVIILIMVPILYFLTWRKSARPELMRENTIGRDIADSQSVKPNLKKVSNLLAYHVHPDNKDKQADFADTLNYNLKNAMKYELLYPISVAKRLRGAAPARLPRPLPSSGD